MSLIIDFNADSSSAFVSGFAKGLAAPGGLFSTHMAPPIHQVTLITPPVRPMGDAGAIADDWNRIGLDIRTAIHRYEKK
jgi:hypothetical protein